MPMHKIYFIRHGRANPGAHRCIGDGTDSPLDKVGCCQALRLGRWAEAAGVTVVFSSPLSRCAQTAQAIARGKIPLHIESDLREVCVGECENLAFETIRALYPEEYAERGRHLGTTAFPGGETFEAAGKRMDACISRLLGTDQGDIAVVGHGGAGRAWLCGLLGQNPDTLMQLRQPWGGITTLTETEGKFSVDSMGLQPTDCPADVEIETLLEEVGTPRQVRDHGEAVSRKALELAELPGAVPVDRMLLRAACLLHDMARVQGKGHAEKGGQLLDRAGWPKLAGIVAVHHDPGRLHSAEARLLFLADKMVIDTTPVSLEERFAASRTKCEGPETLITWTLQREAAFKILTELQGETL